MKTLPFANSLAATSGVFWVLCSLIIWILPDFSLYLTKLSLMGIRGINITGFALDLPTFIAGLVLALAGGWIFGYVWGWFYQKLYSTQ